MDKRLTRLLPYYETELQHLRDLGGEFAKAYPKIAQRLMLDAFECADPYVERLLEGFAFLTARVQLKLDDQFPRFTQHLLECVYPGYLAPMPSMTIVQFEPDPGEGSLASGVPVARGTALRSARPLGDRGACEYRTAHELTLWPVRLTEASCVRVAGGAATLGLPAVEGVRSALVLRLQTTGGHRFADLPLDALTFHVRGADERAARLLEQLLAPGNVLGVVVRPPGRTATTPAPLPHARVRAVGLDDREALLPPTARQFAGYRLLAEYFTLPSRLAFAEIAGLGPGLRACTAEEVEVVLLLGRHDAQLEGVVTAADLALFCTPAINLFERRADRVPAKKQQHEYHVVADTTRPLDFEVYDVLRVAGHSPDRPAREFLPFYSAIDTRRHEENRAYFATRRTPRLRSASEKKRGPRSDYEGSDVWISLVDANEAPFPADLTQISFDTLCTNRDLPFLLNPDGDSVEFLCLSGAPVRSVRTIGTPSKPRPSHAHGATAWRLVSHLSLNYLTLVDRDPREGAAALRELLSLYGDPDDPAITKQIDGVRSIRTEPDWGRVPGAGPRAFARGLRVTLELEESAYRGIGVLPLASVLEQFLARHVSINSFVRTVLRGTERGELASWPARIGQRTIL